MADEVKHIEIYSNGIAKIVYKDDEEMLINNVHYIDAILTGWNEEDIGIKR